MKKNKSEQYTFAPEEKEIIQKITIVEASVGEKIQNKRELITTKYYSEFVINTPNKPVTLSNVSITDSKAAIQASLFCLITSIFSSRVIGISSLTFCIYYIMNCNKSQYLDFY